MVLFGVGVPLNAHRQLHAIRIGHTVDFALGFRVQRFLYLSIYSRLAGNETTTMRSAHLKALPPPDRLQVVLLP
jgi:hypothetical protein